MDLRKSFILYLYNRLALIISYYVSIYIPINSYIMEIITGHIHFSV